MVSDVDDREYPDCRRDRVSARTRTLWLVRHGDTIWSESGRIAGRSDIELSGEGQARVAQLATTMVDTARYARWFASPLKRTRETTQLLQDAFNDGQSVLEPADVDTCIAKEVSFDERLVELDFGDWEGATWDAVHQEQGDVLAAWGENWVATAPPDGESFQHLCERCAAWLSDWETLSDDAVVVTHGGCIRALLCCVLGQPLERAMSWSVDLACVYRFSWNENEGRWLLCAANQQSF